MPDDASFQLMTAIKAITGILSQVLQCPGINIVYNMGSTAGQKIGHVSFDIIPRYAGDKVVIDLPEGKVEEEKLYEEQRLIIKAFQESTVKLLKAIKSGEIKVSDEVKAQAEKALKVLESNKAPINPLKEKDERLEIAKLEEELEKL